MKTILMTVEVKYEHDVVLARQRARQIGELLGFEAQDQARIATSVSELARNAYQYGSGGRVEFLLQEDEPQSLVIRIIDRGPGIPHLDSVLNGQYKSPTGMGLGLVGARRLMDSFAIESAAGKGTAVSLGKRLPKKGTRVTSDSVSHIVNSLAGQTPQNPFEEIQRQNQELLAALAQVQQQRAELEVLNRELEETNRGVVALYAELDERADYLRRASDLKTQFLSNMTHEFRTPVNSILSMARMLLDGLDGSLTAGQEKQVRFIRAGAEALSELVNDLLDLAKVEAGKVEVRPTPFDVVDLFGALRGMLRPLVASGSPVSLVFDDPLDLPTLHTDESKVSQILRNFISNGIKYTERGEVRVRAEKVTEGFVTFSVSDTGVGISPSDQSLIFKEFTQIQGEHQRVKGTGLGLPLAKKLAELLGGHVSVKSVVGSGSTFQVTLPIYYQGPVIAFLPEGYAVAPTADASNEPAVTASGGGRLQRVLIVDDDEASRYAVRDVVREMAEEVMEVSSGLEALRVAHEFVPDVILLDLRMPGLSGFDVLERLTLSDVTRAIQVVVYTSSPLSAFEHERLNGRVVAVVSKDRSVFDADFGDLRRAIASAQTRRGEGRPHA